MDSGYQGSITLSYRGQAALRIPPSKKSEHPKYEYLVIQSVTFLGWLSDPFKGLSDLQLGDEKVTLNHLVGYESLFLYEYVFGTSFTYLRRRSCCYLLFFVLCCCYLLFFVVVVVAAVVAVISWQIFCSPLYP